MTRFRASLSLAVLAIAACAPPDTAEPFDILIAGGLVYDGSDAPPRRAAIGIRGDRIVSVSAAADADAALVIDAAGMAVVPGFIDPHTHALPDLLDPATSANLNYLAQGVATVVVGNDGAGVANRARRFARISRDGIGSNIAFFAGHNELRRRVMGLENRAPTAAELDSMRALLAAEMRAGALGLSTGLYYTPGSFAATGEVVVLAKTAARHGGIYDSHMRSESSHGPGLLAAVDEVLEIGEKANIPVHIAHLKALGSDVWGTSGDVIARIDAARARGLSVTADQYPYRASGTRFSSALVPQWARADSREAMFRRFENADIAARLRTEMAENLAVRGGPAAMLVTDGDSPWRGMTLADIADREGVDPLDAALRAVREGDPSIANFVMQGDDIDAIALQPWVMTGSDGSTGHPRKYGSYPAAYRRFVVEQALMTTERFVHRSSGLPADTLGICDRGYLETGRRADVAVIDFDNFRARADFEQPERLAAGVVHLVVNGTPVIADGEYTGALPGMIVDRRAAGCTAATDRN